MKGSLNKAFASLLCMWVLSFPHAALAVSYTPAPLYHRMEVGEAAEVGDTIYLFHSGTPEVKRTIRPGDIISVFRISTSCRMAEEGKVRIVSFVGNTYLKGQVVEGDIRAGDIARKGSVSCLVISAGMCGQD